MRTQPYTVNDSATTLIGAGCAGCLWLLMEIALGLSVLAVAVYVAKRIWLHT